MYVKLYQPSIETSLTIECDRFSVTHSKKSPYNAEIKIYKDGKKFKEGSEHYDFHIIGHDSEGWQECFVMNRDGKTIERISRLTPPQDYPKPRRPNYALQDRAVI